ncbi:MAG: hypothetical protein SWZ49_25330, partial [Cyanobacteriota bacterium]|nr:hypothetical protein [Cyanobacteriota bacterium]
TPEPLQGANMKIRRLEQARNSDRRITSKTWESTRMALRDDEQKGFAGYPKKAIPKFCQALATFFPFHLG